MNIYTINARDNVMYKVLKNYFSLSDNSVYRFINEEFVYLEKCLSSRGIAYSDLKRALVPDQEKNHYEICLVFDTLIINDSSYGKYIFDRILSLLSPKSTYSVLVGEYIDIIGRSSDSQDHLKGLLENSITESNSMNFVDSNQFYLMYFNSLAKDELKQIIKGLSKYLWFIGYVDLTYSSPFKTYLSLILCPYLIKNKRKIIQRHPEDVNDNENQNTHAINCLENGYECYSINERVYLPFLCYKIEANIVDKDDIGFSFNSMIPKIDCFDNNKIQIDDRRWYEYLACTRTDGKGKEDLLLKIGYSRADKERFINDIYDRMSLGYIYNMKNNAQGELIFDVILEFTTNSGNLRKTTIAIKKKPNDDTMYILTVC